MGLLDDDYKPLYVPPTHPSRRAPKQTALSQESRDSELNNHDRTENTEDFADSPFADRA